MVDITHYLVLSTIVFSIGVVGVLTRRNVIIILMSIELMLNSVNLNLVAFSDRLQDPSGQVFAVLSSPWPQQRRLLVWALSLLCSATKKW